MPSGGIYVEVNRRFGVLGFKKKKLRDNDVSYRIGYIGTYEDDPVLKEPGKNIIALIAPACTLNNVRYEIGYH
jgi:hypothetical protein